MTLACRQHGGHDGTPLVLVHGFLGGGEIFSPNIQRLRELLGIITVDLPGFGESHQHAGTTSIDEMASQVLATLDALPCPQFNLLGHSMGGMVALQMALDAPQRINQLILYATNSAGHLPERFETFAQTKSRLRQDFAQAKDHICATWFRDGSAHPHFPLIRRCADSATLQTALNAVDAMENFDQTEQAAHIKQPVLVIGAQHDRTYSPQRIEQLHQRIPQSQLSILDGCAHNAHLESEDEFNALLLRWLDAP